MKPRPTDPLRGLPEAVRALLSLEEWTSDSAGPAEVKGFVLLGGVVGRALIGGYAPGGDDQFRDPYRRGRFASDLLDAVRRANLARPGEVPRAALLDAMADFRLREFARLGTIRDALARHARRSEG